MATMQEVVDRARIPLNDADKDRYSDDDLLGYANAGIARAYEIRPDLKFGAYGTPFSPLSLSGTFPLSYGKLQTIADYVTFRAETADDEHVNSNRAIAFNAMFEKALTT